MLQLPRGSKETLKTGRKSKIPPCGVRSELQGVFTIHSGSIAGILSPKKTFLQPLPPSYKWGGHSLAGACPASSPLTYVHVTSASFRPAPEYPCPGRVRRLEGAGGPSGSWQTARPGEGRRRSRPVLPQPLPPKRACSSLRPGARDVAAIRSPGPGRLQAAGSGDLPRAGPALVGCNCHSSSCPYPSSGPRPARRSPLQGAGFPLGAGLGWEAPPSSRGGAQPALGPAPPEETETRAPGPAPRASATMSWVRAAVSRSSEDVFDEDADEMHLVQKEWKSTMEKRIKEGYRDGVEAGKEHALQQGFNQGYREGAKMMRTCGQFKGILNALLSWCHLNGHDSALLSKINDLLHAAGKYEEHVLKCLNSIHTQPHLGELLDSVQDMDLSCTIPAEEEFSGTKSERPCGSGTTFSENCCKSNSEADSVQSEYCQTKKHGDSEGPTFAWVKEQTVCLIKQLGLSWDILQLIQQLES